MVNGIYYSRMEYSGFMWAMVDGKNHHPAHFGDAEGPINVIRRHYFNGKWTYSKSVESLMIMPEGLYRW